MTNSTLQKQLTLLLATGFGSGYAPKAPGTVGTMVAVLPLLLLQQLPLWSYGVIVVASCLVGVLICSKADVYLGSHDNKVIVWDEFCGYWITMFAAPSGWIPIVLGFMLFRFFDIVKPWPVSWADKNIQGGIGVMLDDILAGILAWSCINIIYLFV